MSGSIDNAMSKDTVTNDNIDQIQSKKTYLNKSIIYVFKEPVNVEKSKYSLLLTKISVDDQAQINEILTKLDSSIKIKENAFIDSKKIIVNKCMIIVEIHGFRKIGTSTKPIWEIKKAERCMEQNTLTFDNSLNIDISCSKPVDYYQFKMNFFLKPIIYTFQEPVKLKRCPFNMQILEISTSDKITINNVLLRIDQIFIIDESPYINEKEMDENDYKSDNKYLLTVQFKGYKRSEKTISPIWKIKSVQNAF